MSSTTRELPFARQARGLVGWLVLTFAAGAVGAIASRDAGTFYEQLARPDWAPAASIFGPVWSALYLLIGVAAWLVWRDRGFRGAGGALLLFLSQLVANALWTWFFFAWRKGSLAFADIVVLCFLIIATLVAFWRLRPLAGALLLPYLLWVSFAVGLTYSIWKLNPQLLA